MAYATRQQYDVAFPGRTVSDDTCDAKLESATRAINAELKAAGIDYSSHDEEFAANLMDVCCSVANRIMPQESEIPQGATSVSMAAVGFSQSFNLKPAYGTPSLIRSERRLLGIGGKIGVARPSYGRLEPQDD